VTLALLVGIGLAGGVGAIARFALDGAVSSRAASELPLGTLAVNLSGAFVLGIVVGSTLHGDAYRIAGTGALGAYTTFSTWVFESQRLGEDGELWLAAANLAGSIVAGVLAIWIGRAL
jgi:CrcB protein